MRLARSAAVFLALLFFTTPAHAAFPGQNGKIAFVHPGGSFTDTAGIWTMNPDGTGATQITAGVNDRRPAWSPQGTKIAFDRRRPDCSGTPPLCEDIYIVNPDGSGLTLAVPNAKAPSWSPAADRLAFMSYSGTAGEYIFRANLDGSDRTLLYSFEDADIYGIGAPAWAPDHTKTIAFHEGVLAVSCNEDLEECANFYPEHLYTASSETYTPFPGGPSAPGAAPNWSPTGDKLAFYTPQWGTSEFPGDDGGRIGVMSRDGSEGELLTPGPPSGFDARPAWSPDGTRIVFDRNGDGIRAINSDGLGDTGISAVGSDPDWQPLPDESVTSHIRPKSATPLRVPLVPAAKPCASPNRTHGPPLAFGSCNPPRPGSSYLTVGVGDGSPALARSSGSVRMDVQLGAPGAPEDSDVAIRFSLTNVMRASDLSEYTGELRTEMTVRRTDRDGLGFAPHSTSMDFPFGFTVQCSPTPGSSLDASSCVSFTSVNAVIPGAVKDTNRAVWAADGLRVYDGGPDEDADTGADNSLFMTQGVFVP